MADSLSADAARRVALAAQGFRSSRRRTSQDPIVDTLARLQVLQIDSVNVFARSHYLPVFSRYGAYSTAELDGRLWEGSEFTEYWAHEAAFIPVSDRPLFAWRMRGFYDKHHRSGMLQQFERPMRHVRDRLRHDGPQFVRDLEGHRTTKRGPWWDWSETKRAVEMLFAQGEVVSVGRTSFQRRYALAEQVLPDDAQDDVPRARAQRDLVERAARAHGVATLHDLADYYRIRAVDARVAVQSLCDEGILLPVTVDGWKTADGRPLSAWMHRDTRIPSRLTPDALLTPFDPVVWYRPRAERLFDFHYRIEIYTPKSQRQYGYYCLPLMVGGRMAGRIDLKADRARRTLLVQAAWQEHTAPARSVNTAVDLLTTAAHWQGLEQVSCTGAGNLPLPAHWQVPSA